MPPPWLTLACPEPSAPHIAAARDRQARLTKPAGALGRLEDVAVELAGLQATDTPRADSAAVLLFAADHGITAEGVSAYPSAVTVEMLRNFTAGGAAIAVLAAELGASLHVVDAGTLAADPVPGVVMDKPRCGTRNFASEPAMSDAELTHALDAGRRGFARTATQGLDILILGEMGIGNTTSAAAIAAALTGLPPERLAGAGTGLAADGVARKAAVITRALALHRLGRKSPPLDVLRTVGGLEIAALTGAIVAAAQARVPVLVDGFIVSVAALLAARINPTCRPWLMASHRSAEAGHGAVLEALGARPLLDLALRLGEGSGAALTLPMVRLACALHNRMATFDEANVSRREGDRTR